MARKKTKSKALRAYEKAKATSKPGEGKRFAALKGAIAARGGVRDPGAVSAAAGRKKFGKKRFQAMAAAGRRRA